MTSPDYHRRVLTDPSGPSVLPVAALSVVVPVYDAAATLDELVARLRALSPSACQRIEIVLVDDGSRDHSWDRMQILARTHPEVRAIRLMRNYGQQNAVLAGIRAARYELTVTLDDDLQHPPEEIPKLLAMLQKGYDVVYGRPMRERHGLGRRLASRITKFVLQEGMGAEVARHVGPFRAFRTHLRRAFDRYGSPFVSIDVLLTWSTTRFGTVTVRHDPRLHGRSNYGLRRLVLHGLNMATGFTTVPLQIASILGFALTLFGLTVLIIVIGRYFFEGTVVPGFTFLASLVAILSGAQLFVLGVIGEYLARMHFRLMERPPYVVASEMDGQMEER